MAQFSGFYGGAMLSMGVLWTCEHIADLGGLRLAFHALHMSLAINGHWGHMRGFRPEQRYFLYWEHVWRLTRTEEHDLRLLAVDPPGPCTSPC